MRSHAAAVSCIASFVIASAGCSGDAKVSSMILEVAAEESTCAPESVPQVRLGELNLRCALISVCERVPGEAECTEVPAVRDEQYGSAGMGPLGNSVLVPINASLGFGFQIQLHGEDEEPNFDNRFLEVSTELYDGDGLPIYRGLRTGVRADAFFDEPLRMRVYPFASTACAGPNPEGGLERRFKDRAFHTATRLPNGDVLIYGGVRGESVITDLGPGSIGSSPQPIVEVYRVQEGRVVELAGEFSRVLFSSVLLTDDPDAEQYRIYVSGGFDTLGSLLRYDVNQNLGQNFYGTPLLVGESAEPQSDAILVYDRAAGTLTVEDVDAGSMFGAVVGDDDPNMAFLPVVGGVTNARLGAMMEWDFVRNNRWISRAAGQEDTSGMATGSTGNADRFGHSATLLPSGQTFVWGGNMATTDGLTLESTAGEIFRQDGMTTDASGPGSGAPAPTAFHTATALGMAEVMLIGGLKTSCLGTLAPCGQNGITVFPADNPVVRMVVTPTGITDVFAYASQPFENSIFHTATRLDEGSLLMVGGSSCTVSGTMGCDRLSSLTDQNRIFTVSRDRGAFNDADDDLPATLLQGRFGHQVTRLDACPEGATDCGDPRYLVTGGFVRISSGDRQLVEATRVGEVIFKQRTGSRGALDFDDACNLMESDGGTDAGTDTGAADTGGRDSSTPMDSGVGDAAADAPADVPVGS